MMRPALYFFLYGTLAGLTFVSGLRNVTLDDNDSAIVYSPGWDVSRGNDSFDFGRSLHFSDNETVSASLTFQGVAVYLMAPFWSSSVGAQVAIDAGEPFVIGLEAVMKRGLGQETLQSQVVWGATELPNTQHTLVISMPAGFEYVILDGLIYSVLDEDAAVSISTTESTSFSFTTITTTESSTSSPSFISTSVASPSFTLTSLVSTRTTRSSSLSSSSHLPSSSTSPLTVVPINVATSSHSSISVTTVSATPEVNLSTNGSLKRSIAIGSIFGVIMVLLAILALLFCLRRRRIRKRKEQSYTWSQKFTPYASHPTRIATGPPPRQSSAPRSPFQYAHSPTTAVPLLPAAPPARRMPRSPLATAPPIMPPSPSPRSTQFPVSSIPVPSSPMPATPLPLTPVPPVTPGTPWSTQKSQRFSTSSAYSYQSSSVESGVGYGWTTPSLVGIHPFSASAEAESSASGSTSRLATKAADTAPLTPKLSEKSAAALFHSADAEVQRFSAAPAYQEKDARRLFAVERPRAGSRASEAAPPLYEP
ncbi:hypothetical protein B0H11DRAFT_2279850 [Mycena galericulata]|nr:hypothetical protein B0H11DRAFT_2279850 [Mycena galericulata]